jgi:hypothetical protein
MEHRNLGLPGGRGIESPISGMEVDRDVPASLDRCDRTNVVDVRVGDPDRFQVGAAVFDSFDEALTFAAWIDDCRLARAGVDDEVAVLLKRTNGESLDVHV